MGECELRYEYASERVCVSRWWWLSVMKRNNGETCWCVRFLWPRWFRLISVIRRLHWSNFVSVPIDIHATCLRTKSGHEANVKCSILFFYSLFNSSSFVSPRKRLNSNANESTSTHPISLIKHPDTAGKRQYRRVYNIEDEEWTFWRYPALLHKVNIVCGVRALMGELKNFAHSHETIIYAGSNSKSCCELFAVHISAFWALRV